MLVLSVVNKRRAIKGFGHLLSSAAHIVGVGAVAFSGSGALQGTSTLSGAGITGSTGSGALASQHSTMTGAGNSGNLVSGSGVLASQNSTVAGAGISKSTGTGALAAQNSTLSGAGTVLSVITGTGALNSQNATVAGVGTAITQIKCSYSNTNGTGNRTGGGGITVTTTATTAGGGGVIANLVNGSLTANSSNSFSWANGQTLREIKFDFGTGRIVRQARWYQDSATSHGTWKWRGSNDDSSYTDIGIAFDLRGVGTSIAHIHTQLINNTTSYRYYKLEQQTGTTNSGPWLEEIEFFIDGTTDENGDTSYLYPVGGGVNGNGFDSGSGGNGVDRNSLVTPTFSFTAPDGTASNLLDGAAANNSTDSTDFPVSPISNGKITFDFGSTKQRINEITWEQNTGTTHGTWLIEASDDNSTWTTVKAAFTFGGSSQVTSFTNTAGYRYYRLNQQTGSTSNSPWLHEIYFRTVPKTTDTFA